MTALILDTSTEKGFFAILEKSEILFQKYLPQGFNNSQFLLPEIVRGLDSLKMSCDQLQYVAVGAGPGSYTGIRVAATVARTLCFSCRIPLVAFCSLEGFIPNEDGPFAALIDAKISGIYGLKGLKKAGQVTYITEPLVVSLQSAGEFLKEVKTLVTPRSEQIGAKLNALYPHHSWVWEEAAPTIDHLAFSSYKKYQEEAFSQDGQLDILYLRKTQAEIEKEQKESG